ncbi:ABATE domain-containing protein [Herbiconiux moechotypicola]|uniref:CGNR zinc finger domain-containing protein n=1 Tax=Herbiconiux moechotypicola TaxID=637393 RepID=A0ABP5Q881_9MICO|nr:ABATE domain-containing protein [Herbiconiux moechotypicola]MCS5729252.1 ABATE domain-containing protein [Herbiconiux moechotypicola]
MTHVFVSGEAALDFAGTLKWRRDAPEELLVVAADLDDWALQSGIVSAPITSSTADLLEARELREAIYAAITARLSATAPPEEAVATVNRFAATPSVRPVLRAEGVEHLGSPREVLSALARNAVEVVADPALVVKECGRDRCTRVFVDRSRGSRRAWCGMEECGNRVKAAAYRRRHSTV